MITTILLASIIVFSLFAAYLLAVGVCMSRTHKDIEALHKEFKLYRKKVFRSVRPVFYESEESYQEAVTKAKEDMELSRQKEKEIPNNKLVWLSPFTRKPEKFISDELKEYLVSMRAYEQKEIDLD